MNFTNLKQNICDMMKEEQIKLGYQKEAIRLYYPLLSLNRFLKTEVGVEQMLQHLNEFAAMVTKQLGDIKISHSGERFCFLLPPEAAEYVYQNTSKEGFLYDLIATVSKHGVTIDEVIDQFKKYSNHVHVEKVTHGEFDYLIYFKDGIPDEYRYCLTDEGCHINYHRLTIDDYIDYHFEQ